MKREQSEQLRKLSSAVCPSGNLARDARAFLLAHGCTGTARHSEAVAVEARRLAMALGGEPEKAYAAGWLHDISAVIPDSGRLAAARDWEVEVLPEEEALPLLLHQKLSVVIAKTVFGISDPATLDAIGHHTTLRRGAGALEKLVFLADKLSWDQPGAPPYGEAVSSALVESLDRAVSTYLHWVWERRETMRVIHPWLREAWEEMRPGPFDRTSSDC